MENYIYICPKCGSAYACPAATVKSCSDCGVRMVQTEYTERAWDAMPVAERNGIVKKICQNAKIFESPTAVSTSPTSGQKSGSSFWTGILRIVASIWLAVSCSASLVVGILMMVDGDAGIGLLIIVAGIFLSLVSAAGIMVFLNMADDLQNVRQMLKQSKE